MTKKLRENQIFILIPTHRHIWKESLCRLPLNALCNFVELRDWIPKGHSISYTLLPCHWNSHVECHKPEGQILETTWKPQEKSSLFCSSVTQLCPTLCDPMDCSTPGFPLLHCLLELAQTHVHRVGDAIQPSHPLSPSSPRTFNLSQHQGLFQWVDSSHQMAKVLELQHQHQPF